MRRKRLAASGFASLSSAALKLRQEKAIVPCSDALLHRKQEASANTSLQNTVPAEGASDGTSSQKPSALPTVNSSPLRRLRRTIATTDSIDLFSNMGSGERQTQKPIPAVTTGTEAQREEEVAKKRTLHADAAERRISLAKLPWYWRPEESSTNALTIRSS